MYRERYLGVTLLNDYKLKKKVTPRWMTNVPMCLPLREGEEAQASVSERMETDRVGSQERRCKQVAAEIDE